MSIRRHDNLEIRAPKPVDTRLTVETLADLNNIPIEYRYLGLTSFVTDSNIEYWLENDINTWEIKATSGGGGGGDGHDIQDDQYEDLGVVTMPTRTNLKFGQPFQMVDDSGNDATIVKDTLFASFVDDGLVTTNTVGGISAGTLASDIKGLSITDLFNQIFFPIVLPTYTLPTMSVADSASGNAERGGQVTRSIQSIFSQNDYGQGTNYILIYNTGADDSDAGPFIGNLQPIGGQPHTLNQTMPSVAGVVINVNAQVDYDTAPPKSDNYGGPDPSPPGGGTLNKAWTYTSRNAIWWGGYTLTEVPDAGAGVPTLTEVLFKGGNFASQQLDTSGIKSYGLTPSAGDNWILVQTPPGTSVISAKDLDNNIPFNSLITDFVVITVTDATETVGTEENYNTHYYFSPAGFSGSQTITIEVG